MYFDPTSDELVQLPNREVPEWQLVQTWALQAGIPSLSDQFTSLFPESFTDQGEAADEWIEKVAKDVLQNQQTQLDNLTLALNQTFYNKVVSPVGQAFSDFAPAFDGGTLQEFIPEIGNMASGALSSLSLGGQILGGLGTGGGQAGGAAPGTVAAVEQTMNAAIGAMAPIATINPMIGAVVAVGFMVAKVAAGEYERRRVRRVEADNSFYRNLGHLPVFSKVGDEDAVDLILQQMPENDWTSLFLPRYNPRAEWVGAMRQTGFEFFPGQQRDSWAVGEADFNYHNGNSCLGMIPGTQQVSGSLQSRLTENEMAKARNYFAGKPAKDVDMLWEWAQLQAPTTMGSASIDTGDYYPSSAQTLSFLWGHIQSQGSSGNPDLYKLNCPRIDGQWRDYCEGAWEYVNEMCGWDMYSFDQDGKSMEKIIKQGKHSQNRLRMMEALHSCSVACLLGTYRCYSPELGGGIMPNGKYWGRGNANNCNVSLNSLPSDCRQNIWKAYIHDRVVALHEMQYQMLSASLVCAYVRETDAAFNTVVNQNDGGQALDLRQKLRSMRNLLLDRPDQWKHLVRDNVPRDEYHDGLNWYDQLEDAGAFDYQPGGLKAGGTQSGYQGGFGLGGLALEGGQGFDQPAPPTLGLVGRIPGQELVRINTSSVNRGGGGGSGLILAGAAALAAFTFLKR